ncbi:MAG: DUF115 domain-containing protein [Clostridiaceae bacterium]|nr:DUF115 domain-containing protein [Clostridiaceae bacterium]
MEILAQNQEALETRYPEAARALQQKQQNGEQQVTFAAAKDGTRIPVVEKDGKTVRLNSAYQPAREARRWVSQYPFQNLEINVMMFGFGNGLFVRELLAKLDQNSRLLLLEPDFLVFSRVAAEYDIADILLDSRVHFVVDSLDGQGYQCEIEKYISWSTIPTQIICCHPGYDKLYPAQHEKFWSVIRYVVDWAKVRRNTNAYFAQKVLKNAFYNMRYIKESNHLNELAGTFPEEFPAIVVAAGPSLDKNIEELRNAQGKAFIMAVDTAVRYLEEKGIFYDCMVTVDPAKPAHYFTDAKGCSNVPLFCDAGSNCEITGFHTGRKIWFNGDIFLKALYKEHGVEMLNCNGGGSVATAALVIAEKIGFSRIILVGQDLAYSGEITHAGGEQSHILNEESGIEMVEGIDGGLVRSRGDWIRFLKWYETYLNGHPEMDVIDATEGGARIHGTRLMTLAEAVGQYCRETFSFTGILEKLPYTFGAKEYEAVRWDIFHLEKEMGNIIRKSEEGLKYCRKYLADPLHLPEREHAEYIKGIRKVNHVIMLQKYAQDLLDMYSSGLAMDQLRDINKMTGDPQQDEIHSVENAKVVYDAYITGAEEMRSMLEETLPYV